MADAAAAGSTVTTDEAASPPAAASDPAASDPAASPPPATSDPATSDPWALAARLRLSMIRLARQLRHQDPSELSLAQLSALATVVRGGPLGVGQLAELEGLPSPAVTRLADKLEEAGLVTRRANPADRRGILVVATAAGTDLLARRAEVGTAWLAERLDALSESDHACLERVVALLEALATTRPGDAPGPRGDRRKATKVST